MQGALILIAVAWLIGKTRSFVKRSPVFWNIQQKITGFVLIGLGIKIALTAKR